MTSVVNTIISIDKPVGPKVKSYLSTSVNNTSDKVQAAIGFALYLCNKHSKNSAQYYILQTVGFFTIK